MSKCLDINSTELFAGNHVHSSSLGVRGTIVNIKEYNGSYYIDIYDGISMHYTLNPKHFTKVNPKVTIDNTGDPSIYQEATLESTQNYNNSLLKLNEIDKKLNNLNFTNLIRGSKTPIECTGFKGVENQCFALYKLYLEDIKSGDKISIGFKCEYKNIAFASGKNVKVMLQGNGDITGWKAGTIGLDMTKNTKSGNGSFNVSYTIVVNNDHIKNNFINIGIRTDYLTSGTITISKFRANKGEVLMGWQESTDDIRELVLSLREDISDSNAKINNLINKNSELASAIVSINKSISELKSSINENSSGIKANKTSIVSNANSIKTISSSITTLSNSMSGLKTSVATNSANITKNTNSIKSNTTNITTNTNTIKTVSNSISSINSSISSLKTSASTVNNNTNSLISIESRLAEIEKPATIISKVTEGIKTGNPIILTSIHIGDKVTTLYGKYANIYDNNGEHSYSFGDNGKIVINGTCKGSSSTGFIGDKYIPSNGGNYTT